MSSYSTVVANSPNSRDAAGSLDSLIFDSHRSTAKKQWTLPEQSGLTEFEAGNDIDPTILIPFVSKRFDLRYLPESWFDSTQRTVLISIRDSAVDPAKTIVFYRLDLAVYSWVFHVVRKLESDPTRYEDLERIRNDAISIASWVIDNHSLEDIAKAESAPTLLPEPDLTLSQLDRIELRSWKIGVLV